MKALERLPADPFESAGDLAAALGDPAFRHGAIAAVAEDVSGSASLALRLALRVTMLDRAVESRDVVRLPGAAVVWRR